MPDRPFGLTTASGWIFVNRARNFAGNVHQLVMARWPGDRPWLNFTNRDLSPARGECHPVSPDGQYILFGSHSGVLTLVDLPALEKNLAEFEKEFQKSSK